LYIKEKNYRSMNTPSKWPVMPNSPLTAYPLSPPAKTDYNNNGVEEELRTTLHNSNASQKMEHGPSGLAQNIPTSPYPLTLSMSVGKWPSHL
jgi:hypothetical protein